ncbi:uncharacterized protein LOC112680578 isoform X3 [Sipha flava]|uniref:Trimethylguanosine synthase n=1 Tax=Sipha flava TaxID=143950 RepID=A0A8B8F7R4_9HEMI|nr:uncharacterized protein LOC112680578 isoform X3 [Sipha flava]
MYTNTGLVTVRVFYVVIAMDSDPVKIAFARNNARVYGVEDRIVFLVGDFFVDVLLLQRADGIVTSPPVNMTKEEMVKLTKLASRVAPKVLMRLTKDHELSDMNTNNYNRNVNRIQKKVLLFSDGVSVNRRVHWIRSNNLFAYDNYLKNVEEFPKSQNLN